MNNRTIIDIQDAESSFFELIEQIEFGTCNEVIIARKGRPAARLLPIADSVIKLGVADGTFPIPDDIDALNPLIEETFRA